MLNKQLTLRIESAPEADNTFVLRKNFFALYEEDYIPNCEALDQVPVSYNDFTAIRAKYRGNYVKHKTVTKG
jgi:hypothetical protein